MSLRHFFSQPTHNKNDDVFNMFQYQSKKKIPIIKSIFQKKNFGLGYNTLPETNIFAPENQWLEDVCPFGMAYFQNIFKRYISWFQGVYLQDLCFGFCLRNG